MKIRPLLLVLAAACCFGVAPALAEEVGDPIRQRLEALAAGFAVTASRQPLRATDALTAFYSARRFEPAWLTDTGVRAEARQLLRIMAEIDSEGLNPDDYHRQAIAALMDNLANGKPEDRADLDLLLSDAFLLLGSHLSAGKVDAATLTPQWRANRGDLEMAPLLAQALEMGSVKAILQALRPLQPGYDRLRKARSRLAELAAAGPWTPITAGVPIHPGDSDPRIPAIRSRLAALGDFDGPAGNGQTLYDADLAAALVRFQDRHGLAADGVIGPATTAALNMTPAARLQRIKVNLERWRWLPDQLGDRHVRIDLADLKLTVVEEEQPVLSRPVAVGRGDRPISLFSDRIGYIVLNPHWLVPAGLAASVLSGMADDPAAFERLGFSLYKGWGNARTEIDPATLAGAEAVDFPYQLIQHPGPRNALGPVKILFSNRSDVFLQGQPADTAPDMAGTGFGSIRVEAPLGLVALLLDRDSGWTRDRVDAAINSGQPEAAYLQQPVPVHIQYWTAWVDRAGVLQMRADRSHRDPPLAAALTAPPPAQP